MPITITRDEATGAMHYALPGSFGKFAMPPLHESERQCISIVMFDSAVQGLGEYLDAAPAILNDRELSELGRTKKLEPLQAKLVLGTAHVDAQLDRDAAHFDKLEQELLAVPKLEATYTAMAVEDREIRDWWRAQPVDERNKMMKRIESEPGHERLMIALMRSPVPQLEHEVQFVADVWKRLKRQDNPGQALAIDRGRANVEWARRGVSQVAGLTKNALQWDDQRIVRTVLTSADSNHHRGFKAFGINEMTAAVVKRTIAHGR
jgi:hypothetical protein